MAAKDITFCNYAFDLESVLDNQENYYIDSFSEIKQNLVAPATELSEAMTRQANATVTASLYK